MVKSSVLRSLPIVCVKIFLTASAVANSNNGKPALLPDGAILTNFHFEDGFLVENLGEKPRGEKLLNTMEEYQTEYQCIQILGVR